MSNSPWNTDNRLTGFSNPSAGIGYLNNYNNPSPAVPEKQKGLMKTLKQYIEEHKGTLYTLGAIFVIDHFCLKGALRERITKIATNLLDKIQKTLEGN
jgi:hypothetical protein